MSLCYLRLPVWVTRQYVFCYFIAIFSPRHYIYVVTSVTLLPRDNRYITIFFIFGMAGKDLQRMNPGL